MTALLGLDPDLLAACVRELAGIRGLVDSGEQVQDYNPAAIGASDDPHALYEQLDWPIYGGRRWLMGQRPGRGMFRAVPSFPNVVDLLPIKAARLGGRISWDSNATTALRVFLSDAATVASGAQVPQVWIKPGGSWDLLLGDVTWCGSISVSTDDQGFTCQVAEF